MPSMDAGINHNISCHGSSYHVQTELVNGDRLRVDTVVFLKGQVVARHRSEHNEAIDRDPLTLRGLIRQQQKSMIRRLVAAPLPPEGLGSQVLDRLPPKGRKAYSVGASSVRASGFPLANFPRPSFLSRKPFDGSVVSEGDLSIRRKVMRFFRAVDPQDPPVGAAVRDRLRSVSTIVAGIVGLGLGHYVRQDEMSELLMLQSEMADWLRAPNADVRMGQRIWRGLADIGESLSRINQRRRIVVHDYDILRRVEAYLGRSVSERPGEEVLELLHAVAGRSEGIDAWLDDPPHRIEVLRPMVKHVLDQLLDEMSTHEAVPVIGCRAED